MEGGAANNPNLDGGYAWVILAGCFSMYLLVVGTIKSYGILYAEMLEYYQSGSGNTAFIGSLVLLLMLGLGPFANMLAVKLSFRIVAFTGGILVGVGYFLTGFLTEISFIYLTFGLFGGLGYGLAFAPCSTIISFYFEKKRALANGIVVSASGIGALTFPFAYRYLIYTYGLKGTMWIIGGILFNVCCAACCFRQPDILVKMEMERKRKLRTSTADDKHLLNGDTTTDTAPKNAKLDRCKEWIPDFRFSHFKNPKFLMYAISFTMCMNGYGNNLILIPSHIRALGYSKTHMVAAVSIMGACEVVARILFGYIADKQYVQRRTLFVFSMLFSCIFCFISPFFTQFPYFCVYSAIIGIFPGSFWSLVPVLLIDIVGLQNFTSAFGLISLCLACGAVISQPTIGWLNDATGNWHASFILTGCLLLISGLFVLMEPCILQRCQKPDEVLDDKVEMRDKSENQTSRRPSQNDSDSLLGYDDDNDVSFSSTRISRIYKPYQKPTVQRSSSSTSAPLANASDV